jgi:carnitine 3-dehydrogenase
MLESTREGGWDDPTEPIAAPLARYRQTVPAEWVDYNGHMSESFYLWAMGENSDSFFRYVGINEDYRAAGGSLYTVETHMRNLDEAGLGDQLSATLQVLGNDTKRVHITHELFRDDVLIATGEQLLLHVDMKAGRAAAMPNELLRRISAITAAHAVLPTPEWVGRVIAIPQR